MHSGGTQKDVSAAVKSQPNPPTRCIQGRSREHLEKPLAPNLAAPERLPLALRVILPRACRTSLSCNVLCPCYKPATLAKLQSPDNKERPTQPMHFKGGDNLYRGHFPADGQNRAEQAIFPSPSKTPKKSQSSLLRRTSISGTQINHFQSQPAPAGRSA